jgi:hypothetical protein
MNLEESLSLLIVTKLRQYMLGIVTLNKTLLHLLQAALSS